MRRGSTPTHTFTLPFEVSAITDARVIYSQCGAIVLKKKVEDCSISESAISLKLTREETWKFDCAKLVSIQLEVWTAGGDVLVSDPVLKSIGECLDDEV